MEPFLGQIQPFGFNFAPRGWALCNGALLPISSNTALFSLLGTTFGGDGRTTFALPDLRGRSIVGVGSGPGLDTISWGERGGSYYTNISVAHMPAHNHTAAIKASTTASDEDAPTNAMALGSGQEIYTSAAPTTDLKAGTVDVGNTGGSQALNIRNPFLGIYVSIALTGIFPSRS